MRQSVILLPPSFHLPKAKERHTPTCMVCGDTQTSKKYIGGDDYHLCISLCNLHMNTFHEEHNYAPMPAIVSMAYAKVN